MASIAIIGANSFLASYLVEYFGSQPIDLILYSRNLNERYSQYNNCTYGKFDFPNLVLNFNKLLECDAIIYAVAGGVQSQSDLKSYDYELNCFYPIEITRFLSDNNYKGKYLTFGSYFEIGSTESSTPYTELDVIFSNNDIPNSYCDSKRLLSRFFINKKYDLQWFHLILPTLYGKGENSNRLIPYVINKLLMNEPLKLSSGEQMRQYIHVNDVVNLIELIVSTDVKPDVYNVSNNFDLIKIKEVVLIIHEILGREFVKSEKIETRDQGMQVLHINNNKIKKAIPLWMPDISLNNGIKQYL